MKNDDDLRNNTANVTAADESLRKSNNESERNSEMPVAAQLGSPPDETLGSSGEGTEALSAEGEEKDAQGCADVRDSWLETFCEEKKYLENVSPRTISSYRDAWKAFKRFHGEFSEDGIKRYMIEMGMAGVSPGAANSFSRSLNSFLKWLAEKNHVEKPLKIRMLKTDKRVLRTYKPKDVLKILSYEPQTFGEKRIRTALILMVDTGIRICEITSLTRKNVDLENKEITVQGKGRKERTLPISADSRKALSKWLREHKQDLVFGSQQGAKSDYNNLRRDFLLLLEKAGVEKSEGCFHTFRRYFAQQYVKAGCNLFDLEKMLGHSTLDMVKRYTEVDLEDLKMKHRKASPLQALKRLVRRKRKPRGSSDSRTGGQEVPDDGDTEPDGKQ